MHDLFSSEHLFTREVYEAAQAYRLTPANRPQDVLRSYEAMVATIARAAISLNQVKTPITRPGEAEAIARVFAHYKEKIGKTSTYTLTAHRRQKGIARLHECLRKTDGNLAAAEELLVICVDTLAASRFHMGDNSEHKQFNNWEDQLFSSESRMEKWLEEAQRG